MLKLANGRTAPTAFATLALPPTGFSLFFRCAGASPATNRKRFMGVANAARTQFVQVGQDNSTGNLRAYCNGTTVGIPIAGSLVPAANVLHVLGMSVSYVGTALTLKSAWVSNGASNWSISGTSTATSTALSDISRVELGALDNTQAADCVISDVAVWSVALDSATLMLAALGRIHPLNLHPTALAGYWPLRSGPASMINEVNPAASMGVYPGASIEWAGVPVISDGANDRQLPGPIPDVPAWMLRSEAAPRRFRTMWIS